MVAIRKIGILLILLNFATISFGQKDNSGAYKIKRYWIDLGLHTGDGVFFGTQKAEVTPYSYFGRISGANISLGVGSKFYQVKSRLLFNIGDLSQYPLMEFSSMVGKTKYLNNASIDFNIGLSYQIIFLESRKDPTEDMKKLALTFEGNFNFLPTTFFGMNFFATTSINTESIFTALGIRLSLGKLKVSNKNI